MNIPNVITVLRICGVLAFAGAFLAGHLRVAFVVLMVAALSDLLDGLVARLLRQQSDLGSFLDPLADKLFIAVTVLLLSIAGYLPWWLWVSIGVRETAITVGWLGLKQRVRDGLKTRPLASGKAAAFAVMTAMVVVMVRLVVDHPSFRAATDAITPFLFGLCAVLCWVSLVDYLIRIPLIAARAGSAR